LATIQRRLQYCSLFRSNWDMTVYLKDIPPICYQLNICTRIVLPKGKYAGHHPNAAVIIGSTPITPHQLLK
jgi:hypothetical protein